MNNTKTLNSDAPYALSAGEGRPMSWFSSDLTMKASDKAVGVIEVNLKPGDEPPFHSHQSEDEWFYMLEGEAEFYVGSQTYQGSKGAFVAFPRGIPHTFTVKSEFARFLVINTPGGFEHMFESNPKSIDDAVKAMSKFGLEVVAPHPRHQAVTA